MISYPSRTVRSIRVEEKDTWEQLVFITFDLDWACDEVIAHTLDILDEANASVTIFCTHTTALLSRMSETQRYELGIHPNFNPLLNGDRSLGSTAEEVLKSYQTIVPDAVSIRSHSMTHSAAMLNMFCQAGMGYECNLHLPHDSGITAMPFFHTGNRLVRVPVIWEDDIACITGEGWNVDKILGYPGIKVFSFHPIHVFLNSSTTGPYESSKQYAQDPAILKRYVNKSRYGTRDFLLDLMGRLAG